MDNRKRLFLLHGRNFKPQKENLQKLWVEALRYGVERDRPEMLEQLDAVLPGMEFVYYGDHSKRVLEEHGRDFDEEENLTARQQALRNLKQWQKEDFVGATGKANYNNLPNKNSLREALADALNRPLKWLHLDRRAINAVAPDMDEYWNWDTEYASSVRWALTEPLARAMRDQEDVLLVSHSLGTMIAYDVLWKFSHYGEYQDLARTQTKLNTWITMGSPLGNPTVSANLKGSNASGERRYPSNISKWINVSAEDDFICHDEEIADNYRRMEKFNLLESPIEEHQIYNLACPGNKSNPHHGIGYLIHPVVVAAVCDWLNS